MRKRLLRTFNARDGMGKVYRLHEYVNEIDMTHQGSVVRETRDGLRSITTDNGGAVNRIGLSEFEIVSTGVRLTAE